MNSLIGVTLLVLCHAVAQCGCTSDYAEESVTKTDPSLVYDYLSKVNVKKCGHSLMESWRLICEIYEQVFAAVPEFSDYLKMVILDQSKNNGEDTRVKIVDRCCKRSCWSFELMAYCVPRGERKKRSVSHKSVLPFVNQR